MIHVLQSFDPIGVGAQDFVDSLLIQIKTKKSKPPFLYDVVKHDIEDIANKKYRNISKKYSISMREVQEIVDCLRTLNPRPAGDFHLPLTKYISPDVTVQKIDGRYHVILHSELLPPLEINSTYQKLVHHSACVTTDRYVQEKMHEATWLINSIEQRNATIYNVSKAIVEHQQDFFEVGISGLKPLTLKDIAQKVDCHESTVSRATNGKYIQTPRGLFELKYFFTNSLERTDGEQSNSTAFIKEKIKTLIAEEDKLKPLSDQKLMSLLSNEGIQISRRTVAKYREEAGIESSSKRRRF
jgi:RNA polymerase sigma-54 factor